MGRAAVPSGASTGSREAVELRDGDKTRYLGKGVLQGGRATSTTEIARRCSASTPPSRPSLDRTLIDLDGTENKARLGANALLARVAGGRARRGRAKRACRCTATSAAAGRDACRCR